MRIPIVLALCLPTVTGCIQAYETVPAVTPPPEPATDHAPMVDEALAVEVRVDERSPSRRVLILQSTHLDRPAEVVGVVDVHEEVGHHEAALEELRRKAARMGADAVVGVEFHHGEGAGEPTHLSGLAVRFVSSPP